MGRLLGVAPSVTYSSATVVRHWTWATDLLWALWLACRLLAFTLPADVSIVLLFDHLLYQQTYHSDGIFE